MTTDNGEDNSRYTPLQTGHSESGFYVLFALQFLLVAASMFMDVKTGAFTLILVLIMTFVILVRCSSQGFDMSRAKNGMMCLFAVTGVFYFLEIAQQCAGSVEYRYHPLLALPFCALLDCSDSYSRP